MDGEPIRNEYLTSQWSGMSPGSIFYTGGYVGIGTVPAYALDIVDQNNAMIRLTQYNSTDGPVIRAYRALGTLAAPSGVVADSTLTAIRAFGYNSSGAFSGRCVGIEMAAAETFTSSATGTYMSFQTCAPGTTTNSEKMRILGNGNIGIGGVTAPTDALTMGSGSIIITNSTATSNAFYFDQNSVYGGFDIEGISGTGAQTVNYGVNTNRVKTWNSSYDGLWLRVDTRSLYKGFHFFKKAATTGTETELVTIDGSGRVGIGVAGPGYPLEVNGIIATRNDVRWNGTGLNAADKKLYSPADGDLEWMTNDGAGQHGFAVSHQGTKRVYLNTSGNSYFNGGSLGVGTTGPGYTLDVNGNINAATSYYIKSVNMTRKMISTVVNTNSTAYNYTNFGGGFNNAYNFTYTRVNQGSTIEVIAFMQASHAVGAPSVMSHYQITPRIILQNPSGSQQITSAPISWIRIDNSFFEISDMKEIYFTLTDNGSFLTTGQTMTVYVQVSAQSNLGTASRFGLNLWGETTVITINEYF